MKHAGLLLLLLAALIFGVAPRAHADGPGREAGRHFQRGVDLYNDGDFRGALVEFKRAYALLPRASVLYDIGETEFQLQDYAAALGTMRRFLAETGPSAAHRAEVESTVEILRGRVGKISITVDAPRCEVSLDDQPIGTTPLPEPVPASVGPRKIVVACPDRPPVPRRVEVAAGETARVEVAVAPPGATIAPPVERVVSRREEAGRRQRTALASSWTATSLLAAATIAVGTAALVESSQLGDLRGRYPAIASDLDHKASLVHGLSIAADALGLAALAAIGVSTYVTIREHRGHRTVLGLGLGPASLELKGRF